MIFDYGYLTILCQYAYSLLTLIRIKITKRGIYIMDRWRRFVAIKLFNVGGIIDLFYLLFNCC